MLRRLLFGAVFVALGVHVFRCAPNRALESRLPENLQKAAQSYASDQWRRMANEVSGWYYEPVLQSTPLVYQYADGYLSWVYFGPWGDCLLNFRTDSKGLAISELARYVAQDIQSPRQGPRYRPFGGTWVAVGDLGGATQAAKSNLPPFVWGIIGSRDAVSVVLRNPKGGEIPDGAMVYIENGYFLAPFIRHEGVFTVEAHFLNKEGKVIRRILIANGTMQDMDLSDETNRRFTPISSLS